MNPIIVPDYVLPTRLLDWPLPAGTPDPGTASGGFDGIYQFANSDCFQLATSQLALTFQTLAVDGQMLANLRGLNATGLPPSLAGYISGATPLPSNLYVLLMFTPQDILFSTANTACVIEYAVTVELAIVTPDQPGPNTPHGNAIGTATGGPVGTPVTAGTLQTGSTSPYVGVVVLNQPDGATSVAGVVAILASGVLRLPGTYTAETDVSSATIDTFSRLDLNNISIVNASGLLPGAVGSDDPLGILAGLSASLAPFRNVALIPEICPLGLNAGTNAVFTTFEAQVFPTGLPTSETASSLTVALTVTPTVGTPANVPNLVQNADYAIVASQAILNGLAIQRWSIGSIMKSLASTATVSGTYNGQPLTLTITGSFNLLTLDGAAITYNSTVRGDVIAISGTGREYPLAATLSNGQSLTPQGPNDPLFQPGPLAVWTEQATLVVTAQYPSQQSYAFARNLTDNITSLLGRPFTGSVTSQVFQATISAPHQRILLLANVIGGLTAASA